MGTRADTAAGPWLSIILIVRHPAETPDAVLAALAAEPQIAEVEVLLVDGRPGAATVPGRTGVATLLRPGLNMPRLKAEGAAVARGRALAFLEPKAVPLPGWIGAALAALGRYPGAALSGSVTSASGSAADRAAQIFEYAAFRPEVIAQGATRDLSGNNMILPAGSLRKFCGDILAAEGLNKPFCQKRLQENGTALVMVPEMQVRMHTRYRLGALLASRYRYARCFGGTRAALAARAQRWRYRLGAPAVPALLIARHMRSACRDGWPGLGTLGALAALCLAWSAGEAVGSWAGPGRACDALF
ncbi:MAG: hypothetical protein LCH69_17575 [Proteobacteria bacterium]|nr:hypothetical protein [Pseudomonadota bacterium]